MRLLLTTDSGALIAEWPIDLPWTGTAVRQGVSNLTDLIEAELPVDLPDDDIVFGLYNIRKVRYK